MVTAAEVDVRIKRCAKGQKVLMPVFDLGADNDGWTRAEAPNDGLIVALSTRAKSAGGGLISTNRLKAVGYADVLPLKERLMTLKRHELDWLVKSVGVKSSSHSTKAQLVEALLV